MRTTIESRHMFVSLLLAACLLLMPLTAFANKKGDRHFKDGLRYENAQQWEKALRIHSRSLTRQIPNTNCTFAAPVSMRHKHL